MGALRAPEKNIGVERKIFQKPHFGRRIAQRDHAILESQRTEQNEFTSMFERLSAAVASVEKKVSSLVKGAKKKKQATLPLN